MPTPVVYNSRELLENLAQYDEDKNVRLAAIRGLETRSSMKVLKHIAQHDQDLDVVRAAIQQIARTSR